MAAAVPGVVLDDSAKVLASDVQSASQPT